MPNPYRDDIGRFTDKGGNRSGRSADDQSREIASRWSSMTTDQQKVERRRIISNLGGSYGEGAAEKAQFGYSLQFDTRKPPTAATKRRRPTESWLVDPSRNIAKSSGGSVINNVSQVNNAALKGLYGAEGSSRFQEVFSKADENTRNAWELGYRNPRAPKRSRVDE